MSKLTKAELDALVKPVQAPRYEVDSAWVYLDTSVSEFAKGYGAVEMNPDFQRGHVWKSEQQRHYIENAMRGVVPTSGMTIQFNCRNFDSLSRVAEDSDLPDGLQCIDGLQRWTAVRGFLAGEVCPFGLSIEDLRGTDYDPKRMIYSRFRLAVFSFQYKLEVLDHYLALNAGGTPHSDAELTRVRAMRDELAREKAAKGKKSWTQQWTEVIREMPGTNLSL
ncbi:hypothetical protein AB4Y45_33310 [Paraburkholderia sp. EG287A]|uniref:hypothetical protein n=1 Tax=Paraburkholderia sp. EG287A TaxID=3237012 RepID=UPI0034D27E52